MGFRFAGLGLAIFMSFAMPAARAAEDVQTPSLDFANGLYARKMYGPAISEYAKFILEHADSPEVASAKFRLAESFYFSKNYDKAVVAYEEFIRRYPKETRRLMALFRLGTAKFYMKEYPKAQKIFFRLAGTAEDPLIRSGALFYFAKGHEALGGALRMEKILKRVIKNYPQSEYAAYASLRLGDLYASKENFKEAIAAYRSAADRTDPASAAQEAQFKTAEAMYAIKDFKNAEAVYHKLYMSLSAQSDTSEFSSALKALFACEFALKDLAQALQLYRANQSYFGSGDARNEILYRLATLAAEQNDRADALETLDRLLTDPKADRVLVEKAHFRKAAVLSAMDKKNEALTEVQTVIDSTPAAKEHAFFEKGGILREAGRNRESLEAYAVVLERPSGEYAKEALFYTAALHLQEGDRQSSEQEFLSFASKYPDDEDAERATLQAVQIELDLEKFDTAEKNLSAFIQAHSKSALLDVAYYKEGLALTGLKKFNDATVPFLRVIEGTPSSPLVAESLFGLAASFEGGGQVKEAAVYYEKLIRDFPDHAFSKESLLRLGHLYIQMENYEKAALIYHEVLENRPDISLSREAAFWLVRYDLDHARYEDLQRILKILPVRFAGVDLKHATAFFLGESAMGLKDYAGAAKHYAEAVRADLGGEYVPHCYLGLGIVNAAGGNLSAADENFAKALNYDSEVDVTLRARFEIAGLRLRAGDLEAAAKAYMLVAVLYDDDKYCPPALLKAAECYLKLGQLAEARKVTQELKHRYPASDAAKKIPENL